MESLWNGHKTAINSTRSPSRLCGSVKTGVHADPKEFPDRAPPSQ